MNRQRNYSKWLTGFAVLLISMIIIDQAEAQIAAWDFTGASSVATWDASVFDPNLASSVTISRGP